MESSKIIDFFNAYNENMYSGITEEHYSNISEIFLDAILEIDNKKNRFFSKLKNYEKEYTYELLLSTFQSFLYISTNGNNFCTKEIYNYFISLYASDSDLHDTEYDFPVKEQLKEYTYVDNLYFFKNIVKKKELFLEWATYCYLSHSFCKLPLTEKVNVVIGIVKENNCPKNILDDIKFSIYTYTNYEPSLFKDILDKLSFILEIEEIKEFSLRYQNIYKGDDQISRYLCCSTLNNKKSKISSFKIDKKLAEGLSGTVYSIEGDDSKIIKITENNFFNRRELIINKIIDTVTNTNNYSDILVCKYYNSYIRGNYIVSFYEKMLGTLEDYSKNMTEDEIKACIFQVLMTLNRLKCIKFTHYDLHMCNIMITNNSSGVYIYQYKNKKYMFKTRYTAKIIDMGFTHINYFGYKYFEDDVDIVGTIYNPAYDVIKFCIDMKKMNMKSAAIKKFDKYIRDFRKENNLKVRNGRILQIKKTTNINFSNIINFMFS